MTCFEGLSSFTFLAPMAGITDKPFRQMVKSFGNHLVYTEMIASNGAIYNSVMTQKMMDLTGEKMPVAVQIVGNNPESLVKTALLAEKKGAFLIDVNMGCPVRKITTNGAGCALMKEMQLACQIVARLKKAVSIPVSVKTRLGVDTQHLNVVEFALALEEAGADAITIHGRTQAQGYSGKADWSVIKEVKKNLSIPVVVNGDIVDRKTAKEALQVSGADGVMIARGALGKPWVLAQIDEQPFSFDLSSLILEHYDRILNYYGDKGLYIARKHLAWYASGHIGGSEFRQKMYCETNRENVKSLIRAFF